MKLLLLIASFLFSTCAMAQEFKPDISKMAERSIVKQRPTKRMHLLQQKDSLIKQFKAYMAKAKNDNIRYLPQDHMACIVPDAATMAIIPNAWPNVQVPLNQRFLIQCFPTGH